MLGVSCEDYRQHGAFAEFVAVPQHILYRLPDGLLAPMGGPFLADAGLASGYSFELTIVNDPQQRRLGEVIQGMALMIMLIFLLFTEYRVKVVRK